MTRDDLKELTDRTIVALTIFGEARGEPIDGQIAVACVIRNRVNDTRWPDDYRDVCLQKWQFSCWNEHDPTYASVMKAAGKAKTHQFDPVMLQCMWIAQGVCDDFVLDLTRGSNHYHTEAVRPSWAEKMILTMKKGHHLFFRG